VPPNPSELLAGEKMMELIGYLKQHYEYIIIDTPPIGLVSDAMELFKYTDYNILIVRQGVTHKAAVDMINELYVEGKLKNFSVLFNDIDYKSGAGTTYGGGYLYGMGYSGYGYGYYHEDNGKKRFWKKRNS
jgi:Mrp family chromosome partitioning ATPase